MTQRVRAHSILQTVRETGPLVSCITNSVAANITANVLLAVGAAPAMVDITGEAGPFAAAASGLLINLGPPQPEQRAAALAAAAAAGAAGPPWVLAPVAIGSLAHRTALARELIAMGPAVVRGNASEIMALLGAGGGRGPETAADVEAAMDAAHSVSERFGCVVAVSGPVDAIVDGAHVTRIVGGSPMLTRVTGGGCALGALIAAFIAAGRARDVGGSRGECAGADTTRARTVACHAVYSAAAKRAEARSAGPGSFQPAFLDALYDLETDDLGSITISAADTVGQEPA